MTRILLATLHLLAFGIGLGAVWTRAHLLRAPANARRLLESLQQAATGQRDVHELDR